MVIYKTTNLINGKIYIGQNKRNNPKYIGSGYRLKLAVKKYGKKNFKKEIIETCSNKQQLDEREKYWIDFYNSRDSRVGYNITEGGDWTPDLSLKGFIERCGAIEGKQKFDEYCKKISNTNRISGKINNNKPENKTNLQGFILRYGQELGTQKFEKYKNKTQNFTLPKWKNTLEFYINKYGEDKGVEEYNEYWRIVKLNICSRNTKEKYKNNLEGFVARHGIELGLRKYKEYKNKVSFKAIEAHKEGKYI